MELTDLFWCMNWVRSHSKVLSSVRLWRVTHFKSILVGCHCFCSDSFFKESWMDMVASVAIMIIFNLFAKAEDMKNRFNLLWVDRWAWWSWSSWSWSGCLDLEWRNISHVRNLFAVCRRCLTQLQPNVFNERH